MCVNKQHLGEVCMKIWFNNFKRMHTYMFFNANNSHLYKAFLN